MKIARRTCRGDECTDIESMMKIVGGMNVAARRLAKGVVSSANPSIYSKTYTEGSDPFDFMEKVQKTKPCKGLTPKVQEVCR